MGRDRLVSTHRGPDGVTADVAEELRFHVEGVVEELMAAGWTRASAQAEALRRFGDLQRIGTECVSLDRQRLRRQRRLGTMRDLMTDVRYGLRTLRRSPGFALVAVLTLALGMGATTAIFTVVDGVLLKPLPFAQPDRLYMIWERNESQGIERDNPSPPNFVDWRSASRMFESMTGWADASMTLTGVDRAEVLPVARVTWDFFDVLGVPLVAGRSFDISESVANGPLVTVLSHGAWQRLFGGDRSVIGRSITLDGLDFEVVGVAPPWFDVPRRDIALWVRLDPAVEHRQSRYMTVVGRLAPGATAAQAQLEMQTIAGRLAEQYPEANRGYEPYLVSAHEQVVGDTRAILLVVFAAVGFVLLLACTNVASLVLSRATSREGEIAVRAAMGASGGRLRAQLVAENVVLGVIGGVLGIGVAWAGVRLFLVMAPGALPRDHEIAVDLRVLGFAFVTSVLAGVMLGMVPAMRAARAQVTDLLREGSPRGAGSRRRELSRRVLIVAEVMLSVVLLVGAGLSIRSLAALRSVDPGFQTRNVLAAYVSLSGQYESGSMTERNARKSEYFSALLDRIRAMPGVRHAGVTSTLPLTPTGIDFDLPFHAEGHPQLPEEQLQQTDYRIASPGYFEAMGIRIVRGRAFNEFDRTDSRRVLIVNESFAEQHWPGQDPIGRQVTIYYVNNVPWEIVGVAADTRHTGLSVPARSQMFVPMHQAEFLFGYMTIVVQTAGQVAGLSDRMQTAALELDPAEPLYRFETIETVLADATARDRLAALVFGVFAMLALVLSAAGIYGVVSYQIARRTREIGVRMALGASRRRVLETVVGEAAILALAGIGLGVASAFAGTRIASGLLYGISPRDPVTFVAVSVLLFSVAILAALIPALRAASVAPVVALRVD